MLYRSLPSVEHLMIGFNYGFVWIEKFNLKCSLENELLVKRQQIRTTRILNYTLFIDSCANISTEWPLLNVFFIHRGLQYMKTWKTSVDGKSTQQVQGSYGGEKTKFFCWSGGNNIMILQFFSSNFVKGVEVRLLIA